MRISIRLKIVLLGVFSSLLLISIAMISSLIIYRNRARADYINSVDRSVDELIRVLDEADYTTFLITLKENINAAYEENPNDPVFNSIDDKIQYYSTKYSFIYPGLGFDSSYQKINNRNNYLIISGALASISNSNGAIASYISYYDEVRDRFVNLIDSRYRLTSTVDETKFDAKSINIPGSYYAIQDNDVLTVDVEEEEYYGAIMNGRTLRYVDLEEIDDEGNHTIIARAFIEYNENIINESINTFTLHVLIAFSIATVLLVILYAILARQLLTKNIIKLNTAAKEFTNSLLSNNELKVVDPNVNSKDEIGLLSKSYITLEEEIINYTKKIEAATIEKEKINAELAVATKIQLEALPIGIFNDKNVILRASIKSAKEIGGDFYDYFYIDENHLAIIVSDVSGKGIPAALFMMKAKELLKSKLMNNINLEDVCYLVNNELLINNEEGLFITAFVGILDINTNEITLINAGHEKPYIINNEEVKMVDVNSNFILGGIKDFKYEKEIIKLNEGDKLFIHTDGLNEAINEDNIEYGYTRIKDELFELRDEKLNDVLDGMTNSLNEFTNNSIPFDDVTMLIIEKKDKKLEFSYNNPDYSIIKEIINKMSDYYSYLDNELISKSSIIIDEVLNNYISYEKNDNLIIKIIINYNDDNFILDFYNNGEEFNPLLKDNKYIENDNELTIGGFGITIIKEFAKDINYERIDGFNHLNVKMKS